MAFPKRILLLEDTPSDAELIEYRLRKGGAETVSWVDTLDQFKEKYSEDYDLVISDYNLMGFIGTDALQFVRETDPFQAFIICSGNVGDELAADVIRLGANDFIAKANIKTRLNLSAERAFESAILKKRDAQNQKAIQLSAKRLTTIVNNIDESALLLEQEPGSDIVILRQINPAFLELIAQFNDRAKLLSDNPDVDFFEFMRFEAGMSRSMLEYWQSKTRKSLKTGVVNSYREDISLEDGRRYVLDIRINPISADPEKKAQCLVIIKDSTHQVKTEEYILSSIIQAQEKERMRMAHELHDGIGQYLSAAVFNMRAIRENGHGLDEEMSGKLDQALSQINTAITEARTIAHDLMPKAIEDFGLEAAIGSMIDSINQVGSIEITYNTNLGEKRLDREAEINLFRVCQESINNVLKHSGATKAAIQLMNYSDVLMLSIEDNGDGFLKASAQNKNKGIGLSGMKNRIKSIGGDLDISSTLGRGTSIMINLPLNQKQNERAEYSISG